jgi:hypothetical protein
LHVREAMIVMIAVINHHMILSSFKHRHLMGTKYQVQGEAVTTK